MQRPVVSIIIPCYNSAKVVAEAIESALAQTYSRKEIIVIDDGSTDSSQGIIERFGDQIRVLTRQHEGASAARNAGLAIASGELIQFLDADDVLDSRKLERQVPILLGRPKLDVVYSDWIRLYRDSSVPRVCSVVVRTRDPIIVALQLQNIQTSATLYRRGALGAVGGFRSDLPCCQERELNLRLACRGTPFERLPGVLHTKRQFGNSVASNELRVIEWMKSILWEAYDSLEKAQTLSAARREAFAALMAWQGRRLMLHRQNDLALEYFAEARLMARSGGLKGAYGTFAAPVAQYFGFSAAENLLLACRSVKARMRSALAFAGRHSN